MKRVIQVLSVFIICVGAFAMPKRAAADSFCSYAGGSACRDNGCGLYCAGRGSVNGQCDFYVDSGWPPQPGCSCDCHFQTRPGGGAAS
jgi:hypothetical protein